MGFSVTALSLVNRVNRRRRMPDVSAFNATEDQATLDALNTAIDEVCSSRRWEFDIRRAQMTLRPRKQAGTGETLTFTAAAGADDHRRLHRDDVVAGAQIFLRRLRWGIPLHHSGFAHRLVRLRQHRLPCPDRDPADFHRECGDRRQIGTAFTDVTAELFYAEYILPDTVRSVIRVTHQDDPVTLEQVDATVATTNTTRVRRSSSDARGRLGRWP